MEFSFTKILAVGTGGFIGAILRYVFTILIQPQVSDKYYFTGTTVVNLLGCLLIGLGVGFIELKNWGNPQLRLFLFTGLLGGFTTFSAFAFQSFSLLSKNEVLLSLLNIALQVIGGILLVWIGYRLIIK